MQGLAGELVSELDGRLLVLMVSRHTVTPVLEISRIFALGPEQPLGIGAERSCARWRHASWATLVLRCMQCHSLHCIAALHTLARRKSCKSKHQKVLLARFCFVQPCVAAPWTAISVR